MISIDLIIAVGTLISFLLGFLIAIIKMGKSDDLEKYYKETVQAINKPGYLPKSIGEIPTEIIVDTREKLSPLRVFLKKKIAQLRGKQAGPVVLVFGNYSEEEQKAFIIEKAFASSLTSQLLDLDFLESLIRYFAYKHAYESNEIEPEVRMVLRKNFEKSKYRNCVINLDSLEFSTSLILNPPPHEQSLLTNLVLPMVREKEKELLQVTVDLSTMEKWKTFFMTLIHKLDSKKSAVILIGIRLLEEYLEMLNEGLHEFSCLILSARGGYIDLMDELIRNRFELESSWSSEEQVAMECERTDILGWWEFPEEKKVRCKWVMFKKPSIHS